VSRRYLGTQNGATYPALTTAWTNRAAFQDPVASASNPWQSYGMVRDVTIETFGMESINIDKILLADIEEGS